MNLPRLLLLVLTLGLAASFARGADAEMRGDFIHRQAGRDVRVWFLKPARATDSAPVVVVMHGVGRDGERYFNEWAPHARTHGFVLMVPEFSKEQWPGVEGYNYGNTVDTKGRVLPREQWSFSAIEPVFDAVKERTGNHTTRYRLFGHSAGAQFVQRFVYFVPDARLERIVSANAGWYVLPDLATAFPYGLKNTPVTEADLRHALSLPMTVLLGTGDTDPVLHALRHTPESDAQGPNRLERGKFFFARGQEAARKYQLALGWRLATAPDIDHEDGRMAPFAIAALFDTELNHQP